MLLPIDDANGRALISSPKKIIITKIFKSKIAITYKNYSRGKLFLFEEKNYKTNFE